MLNWSDLKVRTEAQELFSTALLVTRSKYDTAATAVIMINTEAEN